MHVTLHMAISIDGFIARADGDSDWVSAEDEKLFVRRCREAGCVVIGRTTYEQYLGKIYPVADADNIILSHATHKNEGRAYFVNSPAAAVAQAKKLGHAALLLSGGGRVSAAFLDNGLIDEIFLSVHPVVLGDGIRLFGGARMTKNFALADATKLEDGLAQLHYKKKS